MFNEDTAANSLKVLYDWVQERPDRNVSVDIVKDKWQVRLTEVMRRGSDWDSDAWLVSQNADGYHLWHVVNEALEKWKAKGLGNAEAHEVKRG